MKVFKKDTKPVSDAIESEIKPFCVSLSISNGDGKLSISYAPFIEFRRVGPFGRLGVDTLSEKVDQLIRTGFFKRSGDWTTIVKELTHVKSGVLVRMEKIAL